MTILTTEDDLQHIEKWLAIGASGPFVKAVNHLWLDHFEMKQELELAQKQINHLEARVADLNDQIDDESRNEFQSSEEEEYLVTLADIDTPVIVGELALRVFRKFSELVPE